MMEILADTGVWELYEQLKIELEGRKRGTHDTMKMIPHAVAARHLDKRALKHHAFP